MCDGRNFKTPVAVRSQPEKACLTRGRTFHRIEDGTRKELYLDFSVVMLGLSAHLGKGMILDLKLFQKQAIGLTLVWDRVALKVF